MRIWLILAAFYAAAGKLGLALAFLNLSATAVWPPTGIAIAALLIFGPRAWPGIFLGAFFVNQTTAGSIATSLTIAAGNTIEALAAWYLVSRFAGGRNALHRVLDIFRFVLLAGLVCTALSATVGVTALAVAGFARWTDFAALWLTWWLGDATGAIVVAPLLLCWADDWDIRRWRPRVVELSLVFVVLVVVGWTAFVHTDAPVGFLALPVCILAAFRFGQREAATATCALSAIAIWGTVHGYGSFAVTETPNSALLLLQAFMAVISLVGLIVGAGVRERTRAEEQARRVHEDSESRLAQAQEVAHIGSWEWNLADGSEWWSDEIFRICGFEPGAVRPGFATFLEIVHPDDLQRVSEVVRHAVETRQKFEFEYGIVRPDGHLRTLRAHGRVIGGESGAVLRMVGTAQDVTASKAAQDFLKRSEQRLKTIIDAEPACVKLVSPDGLLLEMNPAGLEMLGATDISQVVGHRVVDIVYPGDRDRFLEAHRAASAGAPGRLQFRIVGLDGTQRWVDSHMVPFDTARGGDDLHRTVLSVTSDVTAQRHLEEELRQAQKLDALGRLVGSVAHDFNNFLTAIVGYTELSLRQIGDDERVYPDLKNDLKEVLNVVHRASALTKQLLIFSRRPTLDPTPVCVDVVLAPLGPMLAQLLGPEISVAADLNSGETRVRVDPTHLEQIVVNLAVNARDAMPGGGEVRVETRVVEIDATDAAHRSVNPPPGPYVMIAVSDKGGGMDDYVKAHLFEPFFTTKPVGEGTGLGLATVYGIVKQSGGYIWVTSQVGRGTTVTIHFPLVPESPPVETGSYVTSPAADDNATILVVDDDDDVRAVARDVLREHGYRVLEARTGEEATQLATAYTSSIHVVVSDVVLPGINGADLVSRLRRNRPDLKALFISGYGHLAIVHHRILDADAVLLEKPFTSDQLLTYVRAALIGVAASTRTDK